jgi:hypothetical protein
MRHPANPAPVVVDVSAVTDPDCGTVDRLARLTLRAGRRGRRVVLVGAGDRLVELIAFVGLAGVFGIGRISGVEVRRQPEEREEAGGVEEERDAADLPVAQLEDLH